MKNFTELQINEATAIFGGKNEETAMIVSFIAECIGTIAKMVYMANSLRKMLTNPASMY